MNRSTELDFDQRIADWLEEDPRQAPRAALDTVLAAYPSIPQRRAWRAPWRYLNVTTPMRLAAAAILGLLAIGGAIFIGTGGQGPGPTPRESLAPAWRVTGPMNEARVNFTATRLDDGRVLVTGGGFGGGGQRLASAELFDPVTGTWTPTGSMSRVRSYHTATRLPDGRVLVVGGDVAALEGEIYDPTTGAWTLTNPLVFKRGQSSAVSLGDGRVLITGGSEGEQGSTEIYDPVTGIFTEVGDTSTWRASASATLLTDGRVLLAGGFESFVGSAEVFDPTTASWSPTGSMAASRVDGMTATLLSDGTVLVVGGSLEPAERYDPTTGTWAPAGGDAIVAWGSATTGMPDGTVLVAGGFVAADEVVVATTHRFDAETEAWTTIEPMTEARLSAQAVLLDDGRVLVVGGSSENNAGALTSAEIYDPASR